MTETKFDLPSPQTDFFPVVGKPIFGQDRQTEGERTGKTFLPMGARIFQAPYKNGQADRSLVDSVSQFGGVLVDYDKKLDRVDKDGVWRYVSGEETLRVRGGNFRTRRIRGWVRLDIMEKTDPDGNPQVRGGKIIIVRRYRTVNLG